MLDLVARFRDRLKAPFDRHRLPIAAFA